MESANSKETGGTSFQFKSHPYNYGCIILQQWFERTYDGQKFEEAAILESNHPCKYEFLVNLEQGANSFKSRSMAAKMISLTNLLPIEYHLTAEKRIDEKQLPVEQSNSRQRFKTLIRHQVLPGIIYTLCLLQNICASFFKKSRPNHNRKVDSDCPNLHLDEQINCNSNDNSDGVLSRQEATGHFGSIEVNSTTAMKGQSTQSTQSLSFCRRGIQNTDKLFLCTCIVTGLGSVINTRVANGFESVDPEPDEFPSIPPCCAEALRSTSHPMPNPCSAIRVMRHPLTRKSCEVHMQRHCCSCCHCDLMNLQTFNAVEQYQGIRGFTEEHDQNRFESLRLADTGEEGSAVAAPHKLWGKTELDNREESDCLESKISGKQEPDDCRPNDFTHYNPTVGKIPPEQSHESMRKTWHTAKSSSMSLDSASLKKGTFRRGEPCIYKAIAYSGSSQSESPTQVGTKFGSNLTPEAKASETKFTRTERPRVLGEVYVEVEDKVSATEVTGPMRQVDLVTWTGKNRNSPLDTTKGVDERDKVLGSEEDTDQSHSTNERSFLISMEAISANDTVLNEHCLPVNAIMPNEKRKLVKLQQSCGATEQKFTEPYKKETVLQVDIFEAEGHSLAQDEYSIIKSGEKSPVLLPIQQHKLHMLESSADVSERSINLANKTTSRTSGYPWDIMRREEGPGASCDFKSTDGLKDEAISLRIMVVSGQPQEAQTMCPNTEDGHPRSTHKRRSDPNLSATSISVTYPSVFQAPGTDHVKLDNGQGLEQTVLFQATESTPQLFRISLHPIQSSESKDSALKEEGHAHTGEAKEYHVGQLNFTKSFANEGAPNGRSLRRTPVVTIDNDVSSCALNEIAPTRGSLQNVNEDLSTGLVLSANTVILSIIHTEPTILDIHIDSGQHPQQNPITTAQPKPLQEVQSQMTLDLPLHVGITCDEKPQSQRYSALEFALSHAWPGNDLHQTHKPQDATNEELMVTEMKLSEAPMNRRLSKESLVGIPERSLLETLSLSSNVNPPVMYDKIVPDSVLPTQKTYSTLEFALSETRAGLMFVSNQELHPQYSAKATLPTPEWLRVRRLSEASLPEQTSKESSESIPEQPLLKQLGSSSLTMTQVDITNDGMLTPQKKYHTLELALSKAWAGITSHSHPPYKDTQDASSSTRGKLSKDCVSEAFTHHPLSKDSLAEIPEHPLNKLSDFPVPVSSSPRELYDYDDEMPEDKMAGMDLATVHAPSQQSDFKPVHQTSLRIVDHGFVRDEDEATKIKARTDKEPARESDAVAGSAVYHRWDESINGCCCRQLICTVCGCQFHRRECGCFKRSRLHSDSVKVEQACSRAVAHSHKPPAAQMPSTYRFGDQVLVELGSCLEEFGSIDPSKDHCMKVNSVKPTPSIPIQRRLVCLCRPLPWQQWIRGPTACPGLVPSPIQSGQNCRRTFQ